MSACRLVASTVSIDPGRFDHALRHGVDQHPIDREAGIASDNLAADRVPEHHAVALGIGFGHDGQQPAGSAHRKIAGEAGDPLDAGAGEDRDIHADLDRQPPMRTTADAGIFALAVLAHDHPVDGTAELRPQRARQAGQQARRPDVGVLIEALADGEAQTPERDVVGQIGVADRAEVDRRRSSRAERSPSAGIMRPWRR